MNNTLVAEERVDFRKSTLHKLRNQGMIPSVIYGNHEQSKAIAVKDADLMKALKEGGRNGIFALDVNGNTENVILADYQYDPLSLKMIHADFHHVDMSTIVHTKAPVQLTGTPQGVETGGVLEQSLYELNISAKPKDIPEEIEVDVASLKIGQMIKVSDIRNKYPKITINHEDDKVIATVLAPATEDSIDEQPAEQAV